MSSKLYWRSLEELTEGPRAPERELAPEVEALLEAERGEKSGVSRRGFLQVLGAGSALAALDGCNEPNGRALPFTRPPVGLTPGNPLHFATATTLGGYASALLVTSWEGRPTKVEGNPEHPVN